MRGGCDSFWCFFEEKIDKLLINLHCTTAGDVGPNEPCFTASIQTFDPTMRAKIYNILAMALWIKQAYLILYLLRNYLVSDNVESVMPVITYTSNTSLENAVMPVLLKHAVVQPLLKKQSLNKEMLNNAQLAT